MGIYFICLVESLEMIRKSHEIDVIPPQSMIPWIQIFLLDTFKEI